MTALRTRHTSMLTIALMIACFVPPGFAAKVSNPAKPGTLKCSLQHAKVVVRQLVMLRCDFFTNEAFINVREEPLKVSSATTWFIPPGKRTDVSPAGSANRLYRFRFGWAIYPKIPGRINIRLDQVSINFDPFRPDIRKFRLDVRALPTYLQPDIPVGQLQLKLVPVSSRILRKHRIYRFQASITGKGIPADRLPDYNILFGQQGNYSLYVDKENRKNNLDINGLTGVRTWQLGLVATRNGSIQASIPPLNYYDPVKKKVMTLRVDVPGMFAVPSWLYFIGLLLLLLLAAWLIRLLFGAAVRFTRYIIELKKLAHRISGITNCTEASALLKKTGDFYGIPDTVSLNRFYRHWQHVYGDFPELENVVDDLNQCCFSKTSTDPDKMLADTRQVTRKLCRVSFAVCKRTCLTLRQKFPAVLFHKHKY